MLVHKGNHIGDSWYYSVDSTIHCFYLTCPENIARHTVWRIEHATSSDLVNWVRRDTVLEPGTEKEWDHGTLATGSVIRKNGRYWMAYTARWDKPDVAVGLAVSDDLYVWEKCPWNPITSIDAYFYEPSGPGSRNFAHWRDPFLFATRGAVYHYVCASSKYGPRDARGTLGFARTEDMVRWKILPPVSVEPVVQELECPQVREIGGRYYLIYSAFPELFSDETRRKFGSALRNGTYAMVGESMFGPFFARSLSPILRGDYPIQPYACQVVPFNGKYYLIGTVWDDKQDFICDPIELAAEEDGLEMRTPKD